MASESSSNGTPQYPTARLLQVRRGPEDDRITQWARLRRPGVVHWWGRRSSETGAVALCYLCDVTIATWSGRWPITVTAQLLIDAHRALHLAEFPRQPGAQEASER